MLSKAVTVLNNVGVPTFFSAVALFVVRLKSVYKKPVGVWFKFSFFNLL